MGTPWVSFDGKDCSGCKHLNERGYCEFTACIIPCTVRATIPEVKPQTNADRVRSMSDGELADYINSVEAEAIKRAGRYLTKTEIERGKAQRLDWLRQEALP